MTAPQPLAPTASVVPIGGAWTVRAVGDEASVPDDFPRAPVPATVPGSVHTDLLAAGLIPDPYLDRNEDVLQWIGRTDWRYETTILWQPNGADRTDLVFEGLDTLATVELNGAVIARTQNMHRSYRVEVTGRLVPGRNSLSVTFDSALVYAERRRAAVGQHLPGPNSATPHPINMIRKMACNFGWDWGPVLVTAGVWRPALVHSWSTARLDRVRPAVTMADGRGRVEVQVDVDRARADTALEVEVGVAGERSTAVLAPGEVSTVVTVEVADPDVWWPHGHGDQPLYDLDVTLSVHPGTSSGGAAPSSVDQASSGDASRALDSWSRRIGFRSVRLDTTPDEMGSAFTLVVNDVPIFARGANWIPDDCFPTRLTAQRYRDRIVQARAANIDLLRVWGGGLYESDDFYAACDELGVLVWQDFLFACATYPEEAPTYGEVEAEAREAVTRLMPHPSLVLWNGNNENYMGWHEWGWPAKVGERTWGHGYYTELLPRVVSEVDGTRPYWPGSPYSGSLDIPANDNGHGCTHVWDVWNTDDYALYRQYVPRFVSEFGWQAPPTWTTLTEAVHDEPLAPDSPGVLHHQKARDGNGKLARGLAPHFPAPVTMEDWLFVNQLNQARAIAYGVEHWRSHRGRCMGAIVWQLNDCWPVTSWAAIDGAARLKPLWFQLRRSYDPHLLTVQPRGGGLVVVAVNEHAADWALTDLWVRRVRLDGEVLAEHRATLTASGRAASLLPLPAGVAVPGDPRSELLVVDGGGRRAVWAFAEDLDLDYAVPAWDVEVLEVEDDVVVRVTARTVVRDLALLADRLGPDVIVDDMLLTLLPGDTHDFRLSGAAGRVSAEQVTGPPVLRCANDVVLASRAATGTAAVG